MLFCGHCKSYYVRPNHAWVCHGEMPRDKDERSDVGAEIERLGTILVILEELVATVRKVVDEI